MGLGRRYRKPEKATPKKRRDERKKGNVFFSNDAVSVVGAAGQLPCPQADCHANWIAAQIYELPAVLLWSCTGASTSGWQDT
ncbi:MAG: EscU/YscU/HrcU family type III secretion system export apparatus switch protein [Flavonifractor plautii]